MPLIIDRFKRYAKNRPWKFHAILALICLILYSSIIIFGFVPLTQSIEESGYSTSDLQDAKTRQDADEILVSWSSYKTLLAFLSALDYLFIIVGFILLISLSTLLFKISDRYPKLQWIAVVGMFLTILSRTLDSLENLWIILMYSNPDGYSSAFIPLLKYTGLIKWIAVGIEYSTVAVGWLIYLVLHLRTKRNRIPKDEVIETENE